MVAGAIPTEQEVTIITVVEPFETTRPNYALWFLVGLVFFAQLGFAIVMNGRGYLWGDAISRASAALIAVQSAQPHLAAIGFVWMPLPTFLEIIPVALYRSYPNVVSSGTAASLVTVVCGTLSAVIVYATARSLKLSNLVSVAYSIVVAFSPMLFLFSTNGMSEGVAAPFMIGSVCCLVLFWHDGQRRYIAAGGIMLGLAFACLYQAVSFGAAMMGAMVLGLFTAENAPSWPQGRLRAIEGLSILFLVPSAYIAILWVVANAAIMGDPLYFATSMYSNEGYIAASGIDRISDAVKGDPLGAFWFAAIRTLPFFIPVSLILVVRAIEGRLFRVNSLTLTGLCLIVPMGLIMYQLYGGTSFGWLRYFMYPLYVAAGWGLFEIAKSKRRNLAMALVFTGWLLAVPASLIAMNNPEQGQNEFQIVRSIWTGEKASENGYPLYFDDIKTVSARINQLRPRDLVLVDSSNAWTIAATVEPRTLKQNMMFTSDNRFHDALEDPARLGVEYLLVPNPAVAPQDLLIAEYPRLWQGDEPGFTLVQSFSETGVGWKLYRVDNFGKTATTP